ncbi:hypothetical protein OG474_37710 [Kribbella sp. NBC_01505]|uniref:hypothetical protein n=1 Tax=Kribbella sp. NBC_01505 TaxID=2903580 RepID=UPI00386703D7
MSEHPLAFRETESPWRPTEVVEELNAHLHLQLELVGLDDLVGGTSGAAYLQGPDGRQFVLTRTSADADLMRLTAEIIALAKQHGFPVPSHEAVLPLRDGHTAVLQERLPGSRPTTVTADRVAAMVTMNEQVREPAGRSPRRPTATRTRHQHPS